MANGSMWFSDNLWEGINLATIYKIRIPQKNILDEKEQIEGFEIEDW